MTFVYQRLIFWFWSFVCLFVFRFSFHIWLLSSQIVATGCFALILLFSDIACSHEWLCTIKLNKIPLQIFLPDKCKLTLVALVLLLLQRWLSLCCESALTWKLLTQRRSGCSLLATCLKLLLPVQVADCICPDWKMYFYKLENVFVQFGKCIGQNSKLYVSEFSLLTICHKLLLPVPSTLLVDVNIKILLGNIFCEFIRVYSAKLNSIPTSLHIALAIWW